MEITKKKIAFSRLNEGVMKFPESHLWNRGGVFSSSHFKEWYDWSGVLKCESTQEQIGVHFRVNQVVKDGKIVFPYQVALINLATGEVFEESDETFKIDTHFDALNGRIEFKYEEPKIWNVGFSEKENQWKVQFLKRNSSIYVDLGMKTPMVPGFKTLTPEGLVTMGMPNGQFFNPFNAHGMAYYYFAPVVNVNGLIRIGEQSYDVDGQLWFDHVWGNFDSPHFFNEKLVHGVLQLDHNAYVSFNMWKDPEGNVVNELNQIVYSGEKGFPNYDKGVNAFKFDESKSVLEVGDNKYEFKDFVEMNNTSIPTMKKKIGSVDLGGKRIGKVYIEIHD
ncbi:lipocalin-like domain-containing protein [Aureibacter tunicatorum]|uniref:AttH domain-containing protein n=1 Tax=Aureibacter tunicatorum TaxID=866807 RepID=A0AAE3XL17_9BACT|nr:lipocalin-like domain-containing protein [Aureibacter tunicatorum]MDR6238387.1 hypothetical protein [Aureibacter tunicatorum]BDD03419.1 hypothetical protein AUTU_09020 [Aureibacter tunicatorum]